MPIKLYKKDAVKEGKRHGLKLIGGTFVNGKSILKWRCKRKHVFESDLNSIKHNKKRCNECIPFIKLEKYKEIAQQNEGICISKVYINSEHKLEFKCKYNHIFKISSERVSAGRWCRKCSQIKNGILLRLTIEEMQNIAKERGGKCLSTIYINCKSPLKWECSIGHEWNAPSVNVKNNRQWCPYCNKYVSEGICRSYFEAIFDKKFPKTRPEWLKNNSGCKLELDGYCEELGIAFEHQGEQHYTDVKFFSKKEYNLKNRIANDKIKAKLCKDNGIILIKIPSLNTRTKIEDLENLIIKKISKYQIDFKIKKNVKIDYSKIYGSEGVEKLKILKNKVASKGGKLITLFYKGINAKYEIDCGKGHIWKPTAYNIINENRWCPFCSGCAKKDIKYCQELAKNKNGKCLSTKYLNNKTHLLFICKFGHKFKTSLICIKRGHWCKMCSNKEKGKHKRKPIKCLETGDIFESITHATKKLGISRRFIRNSLKNKIKNTNGFNFKYLTL
jgi:hypothetical protein